VDRPVELAPFLAQLGRDHRKFGVLAHHYHALSTAMIDTVRHYNGTHWDSVTEQSWQHAFAQVNTVMQDAANAETGPASWPARVTSHHRITRDIALVQVHTGAPIPYQPGQYLSVETPQRPRLWRYLSPANPTNHEGVIEFHVRAVPEGWVSQSVVAHTQRGDTWHIGSPMGNLHLRHHPNRELLLIAGGTGIAPCLAILQDRARQNGNTPVQVFYGASAVEDLYALHTLHRLTAQLPRLTVIPACHQTTSQPGGVEHGTLADVVTRYGSWTNHDVLICGSPQMIRATVTAMLLAGTPLANIHHDPFTLD
jgi:NAD(P)H-flavin reductase